MNKIVAFFAMLAVLSSTTLAIQVGTHDAGTLAPGTYNVNIPITNGENTVLTLDLSLSPRSEYLEPYVTFPHQITLAPREQRAVAFQLAINDSLGPGKHTINVLPTPVNSEGSGFVVSSISSITLSFTIPGTAVKNINIASVVIGDAHQQKTISVTFNNSGNTRLSVFPKADVWRDNLFVETIDYRTEFLMEPGTHDIQFTYAPSAAGSYRVILYALYDGIASNRREALFTVSSDEVFRVQNDNGGAGGSPSSGNSTLVQPRSINGTIDIDGGVPASGIFIRDFAVFNDGESVVARMRVESTQQTTHLYTYRFDVFRDNELVMTTEHNDSIDGGALRDIEERFTLNYSLYTIVATVIHSGGQDTAQATIEYREHDTALFPTGSLVSDPAPLVTVIIIIALLIIIVYWRKRTRRPYNNFSELKNRLNYEKYHQASV